MPREDVRRMSLEDFIEKYENDYKPVVLTHVQDNWQALEKWTVSVCLSIKLMLI